MSGQDTGVWQGEHPKPAERTTGATHAQIGLAIERFMVKAHKTERQREAITVMFEQNADFLVPPDHRIVGPDDLSALRRIYETALSTSPYDRFDSSTLDRLAALIGDEA